MLRRTALLLAGWVVCMLPAAAAPEQSFRFVACNLENYFIAEDGEDRENRGGESGANAAAERDVALKPEASVRALVAIIADLNPDVLGVMEIGGEAAVADLRARLAQAGVELPHDEWVRGADARRHVALLSRHPITARASRDVAAFSLGGERRAVLRGILDASVEPVKGFPVRFVGVHFKSKRPEPEFDEALFRAREFRALRRHLNAVFEDHTGARLVVFGDFNATRNAPVFRDLIGPRGAAGSLTALELADGRGERWTHHWEEADVYSRIDHILVSGAMARGFVPAQSGVADPANWSDASDHRALFATFNLPSGEQSDSR